jgi:hypothetical protein
LIGDAAVAVVELASRAGKPIVLEQLDFAKKKAELEATHKPLARMLSSFRLQQGDIQYQSSSLSPRCTGDRSQPGVHVGYRCGEPRTEEWDIGSYGCGFGHRPKRFRIV